MIELNRITRLLSKAKFWRRQRNAIIYSSRYVIADKDIENERRADEKVQEQENVTAQRAIEEFLDCFDP